MLRLWGTSSGNHQRLSHPFMNNVPAQNFRPQLHHLAEELWDMIGNHNLRALLKQGNI